MKVITTGLLNRFWTKGIKPWLDKRIKSYAGFNGNYGSGYTPDALAVKEGFTELNGKLETKEEFVNEGTIVSKTGNHVTLNGSQYIQSVTYTNPRLGNFKNRYNVKQYVPSRHWFFTLRLGILIHRESITSALL